MLVLMALTLCTASDADTPVLTPDEIEHAPVSLLTRSQLEREELRLWDPPTLITPVVSLTVGGVLFVLGGGAMFAMLSQSPTDSIGPALLGSLAGIVGATGLGMAIMGGSFLSWVVAQRKAYAGRETEVRARIGALETGQANLAPDRALTEFKALDHERPGYGVPTLFLAAGTAPMLLGIAMYADLTPNASAAALGVSIGLLVAGLALEGIGLWQLFKRVLERAELDEQIRVLAPASSAALPLLPMHVAFGWRV